MKHLWALNKYIFSYKARFLLGLCFVGLSVYFSILVPPTIRKALDFIIDKVKNLDQTQVGGFEEFLQADIIKFAGMVIGFSLLSGFFMYCMRKTIIVMSRLIEYDLRRDIYDHYQALDLSFFKQNQTGDLMSRISEDVSKIRMYLGPAIMYGIRVTFLFSFIIYSMFQVSTTLSLYALLPLPILSISIYYVSSIINKKSALIQGQIAKLNSIAQEVYSGIRIIKSYVKEDAFYEYFDSESDDYKTKALGLARVQALFFPLMILLVSVSTILTIYIGGKLVVRGEISPGNIAEFIIYINMLTWPITSIGWIASIIQQAEASQERINKVLSVDPKISNQTTEALDLNGAIEFRDVTFTYKDTGITAMKDVNFKINKGERVAIVGRTASGKSTIAELLLRFYDPEAGEILINGKNLKEVNLHELRRKIGYVPQDIFLFSDTIESNLKFGAEDASKAQMENFTRLASLEKDIKGFPEGYQTSVGERGVTLSGGQNQRVSIARALIKNPEIVILDDCLSAVDASTELEILAHLQDILEGKTTIVITHRLSNLMTFDKIIVLEEGRISDIGTHEILAETNAFYRQILEYQLN